jgi:hypothetical protein
MPRSAAKSPNSSAVSRARNRSKSAPRKSPAKSGKKNTPKKTDDDSAFWNEAAELAFCVVGLLGSFVLWGILQEKIAIVMKFPSSVFVGFSNKLIALPIAGAIVLHQKSSAGFQNPPIPTYSPAAVTNSLSSWAQMHALKYVSFPVQTIFKSSKIIPSMLVGKAVHGKSYPVVEYIEAAVITAGVALFMLAAKGGTTSTPGAESQVNFMSLADNNYFKLDVSKELLGVMILVGFFIY